MQIEVPLSLSPLREVAHVARRLSMSQEHVRRLIRGGQLPAIRLGCRWRIDPRDLEDFINRQRTAAAATL